MTPRDQDREPARTRIGLVGCGTVGLRLGDRLLRGGHELLVFDRDERASRRLLDAGATSARGPRELGESCDLLVSALPDPADAESVLVGDAGLWADADRKFHVETATIGLRSIRRLSKLAVERGVRLLDCPVSRGTVVGGRERIVMWAGGNADHFDAVRPLLETMADRVLLCGGLGKGQATKLVNNFVAHTLTVVLGEALAAGAGTGVGVDMLRAALHEGTGQNRMLDELLPASVFRGDWRPGLALELAVKDLALVAELFEETGVDSSVLDAIREVYARAEGRGWGGLSAHAVVRLVEEAAAVTLRSPIFGRD